MKNNHRQFYTDFHILVYFQTLETDFCQILIDFALQYIK